MAQYKPWRERTRHDVPLESLRWVEGVARVWVRCSRCLEPVAPGDPVWKPVPGAAVPKHTVRRLCRWCGPAVTGAGAGAGGQPVPPGC